VSDWYSCALRPYGKLLGIISKGWENKVGISALAKTAFQEKKYVG
jgi:hypothetical protein